MSKSLFRIKAEQYEKGTLDTGDLAKTPGEQFRKWFEEAKNEGVPQPEAMNVATAELPTGRVSNRTVLLKDFDDQDRVVFYSNWQTSRKGNDFKTNPWFSVCFFWKEMQRQVRIEGKGTLLSAEESQPYFDSRPRDSRIGAWASPQSQPLASRQDFETKIKAAEDKFEGQDTFPVPPHWKGIRIEPVHWEFWQGRLGRLHDRFYYDREDGEWKIERAAP